MTLITKFSSLPFAQVAQSETEIQQTPAPSASSGAGGADPFAGDTATSDEIVPFQSNTFDSLMSEDSFQTSGATSGSATVGQVGASGDGATVQGQTDFSGY